RLLRWLAPDGRRRMQRPGKLDDATRLRQLGADRRREVLDVLDFDERRLLGACDPNGKRLERSLDPARHGPVFLETLAALEQPLAEVIVDCRVGAATCRPCQRDGA